MKEMDAAMREMENKLAAADNLDVVRGCEGMASRVYWDALQGLLPQEWGFAERNRQPPADPVNAMLSYGYSVLLHNLLTLIKRRGLNPYLGNLHAVKAGHPALASDLMEEFRALTVDAVVLNIFLSGKAKQEDFTREESETAYCRMGNELKKNFIRELEAKFNTALIHPQAGSRMDYRRAMQYQVHHYARVLQGEEPAYIAFEQR